MKHTSKEENILPPIERSRIDFDEKSSSGNLNSSNHKFKVIETAVWTHNGKELIKKDEVTELDRRLNTELKAEKSNLTEYLIAMRRTHDEMIKQAAKKQKETKRLREEIDSMKRQIDIFSRQAELGRREIEGLERNFQTVKAKRQTSAMAGKTLEHILVRMKKDEITYQIKINELQKKARELESAMNESQHKKFQLNEFGALSSIAAKQVKDSYNECYQKRKKDMEQYQNMMRKKKQFDHKSQERQKITDEIQAIAASDLNDSSLLKWKKLLMVQLMLKKILKSKINNLEDKYEDIKNAFHTIKIKTTIDDPKLLALGYFKLEDTYLGLIQNVKNQQMNEKILLNQKEEFKLQLQRLNNEYNEICSANDKETEPEDQDILKSTKQVSQRNFQIKLIEEKMFSWIIENKWKLESLKHKLTPADKKKFLESHSRSKISQYLTEFCQGLMTVSENLQNTELKQLHYEDLQHLQAVTTRRSEIDTEEFATIKTSSNRERKRTIRL